MRRTLVYLSVYLFAMRNSWIAWTGTAFVVVGMSVFAVWDIWLQTRTTRPVYMPVSLAPGLITTPEFRTNLSAQYTIEIEVKKTVPFETLNCLLGMSLMPGQRCDRPPVVRASWTLASEGRAVKTGTSDSDDGGGWAQDTVARELGTFWLEKGKLYVLHAEFSEDARALAPTDPHLKIEVQSDFYEGSMFTGFLLLRGCEGMTVLGLLMLAVAILRWWIRNRRPHYHLAAH